MTPNLREEIERSADVMLKTAALIADSKAKALVKCGAVAACEVTDISRDGDQVNIGIRYIPMAPVEYVGAHFDFDSVVEMLGLKEATDEEKKRGWDDFCAELEAQIHDLPSGDGESEEENAEG